MIPVTVVLVPVSGKAIYTTFDIDNASRNPSTEQITVTFPENVPTLVEAWTP